MSEVWATAAQLQRKILEPRTATEQMAGVRGMLVLVEALFTQGRYKYFQLTRYVRAYVSIFDWMKLH